MVVVVENQSSDGTLVYLNYRGQDGQPSVPQEMSENLGPAGGIRSRDGMGNHPEHA